MLHRLDPRIKLLSVMVLVMLVFAAKTWAQLLVFVVASSIAIRLISPFVKTIWSMCRLMRWLLLFTLLMHLFFSSGRTLWGQSWLSYDGLLTGSFVCLQIVLSVILSAVMAVTTSIEELAGAFGWLVSPLRMIGVQTDSWQKMLLLALSFIPVVHEEIQFAVNDGKPRGKTKSSRISVSWSAWTDRVKNFMMRMINRGDMIAHDLAEDAGTLPASVEMPTLFPLPLLDRYCFAFVALVLCSYWLLGS